MKSIVEKTSATTLEVPLTHNQKLKLAHAVVTEFPEAIIAGGVARDMLMGEKFNDIDIFIPAASDAISIAHLVTKIVRLCDRLELGLEVYEPYYYYLLGALQLKAGPLDICVVRPDIGSPEKLVDSFDMVSSQAWLEPTPDGFIAKATELFQQLNEKKILGYYPRGSNEMSKHIKRITERYSEYLPLALKVPPKAPQEDDDDWILPF